MWIDEDFAEFVGARYESLYRLAYLLTASPTGAEDLLQTTLEKAYANWSRIGRMEYVEAYVRRMLANTMVSNRRRKWNGEVPGIGCPRAAEVLSSCRSWIGSCAGRWCARCPHGSVRRKCARPCGRLRSGRASPRRS